jgi:hypothetical protein
VAINEERTLQLSTGRIPGGLPDEESLNLDEGFTKGGHSD